MVERQPHQEQRMRQPLVTIDAVKPADQQSSREQPRAMPFIFSSGSPQKPPGPKIDHRFKRCALPMDFCEIRSGSVALHVVESVKNSVSPRPPNPTSPPPAHPRST